MSRKAAKTRQIESAQSLATSFQTEWLTINYLDNVGYLINTSGVTDNTGTFGVEVRMDDGNSNVSAPASLTLSAVPTLNDTDSDLFIDLREIPATQVRLTFTAAGGTPDGTAAIFVHSKTVGM